MMMAVVFVCGALAAQGITLYGPSPYTSFADSPFDGGAFTYFFLEDFEDGLLNVPGVTASGGFARNVASSGSTSIDSVDGDDGTIDGLGQNGAYFTGKTPVLHDLFFFFDPIALGGLPTHVGIVWTDVGGALPVSGVCDVRFEVFNASGTSLGSVSALGLGDGVFKGETSEDRFFGAMYEGGISKLLVSVPNEGSRMNWEVDHLQYGAASSAPALPDPAATWLLFGLAAGGLVLVRRMVR
jgi:hypothetical protein